MINLRYLGNLRFSQSRNVGCPKCRTRRGDPCRTLGGVRVGRAVSYTHVARRVKWWKERNENS